MVFFAVAFLFPRRPTLWIAAISLSFSIAIEFSQLDHAPWIEYLRSYTFGHLVLGSGFAWIDIAAYTLGILAGHLLDLTISSLTPATRHSTPN